MEAQSINIMLNNLSLYTNLESEWTTMIETAEISNLNEIHIRIIIIIVTILFHPLFVWMHAIEHYYPVRVTISIKFEFRRTLLYQNFEWWRRYIFQWIFTCFLHFWNRICTSLKTYIQHCMRSCIVNRPIQ